MGSWSGGVGLHGGCVVVESCVAVVIKVDVWTVGGGDVGGIKR